MTGEPLPRPGEAPCVWVRGVAVPASFPYLSVLLQGRPRHGWDDFARRHPPMEIGKRAKLFAPYDALDGYSAHVREKNALYVDRIDPDEEEKAEMNRRLLILRDLTANRRLAKKNRVEVTVRYFVPCGDPHSFSYGVQGQYRDVRGIVRRVDAEERALIVGETAVPFDAILRMWAADESLFLEKEALAPPGEGMI